MKRWHSMAYHLLIADIRFKLKKIVTGIKVLILNIDNRCKIETSNKFYALMIRKEEMTPDELS